MIWRTHACDDCNLFSDISTAVHRACWQDTRMTLMSCGHSSSEPGHVVDGIRVCAICFIEAGDNSLRMPVQQRICIRKYTVTACTDNESSVAPL